MTRDAADSMDGTPLRRVFEGGPKARPKCIQSRSAPISVSLCEARATNWTELVSAMKRADSHTYLATLAKQVAERKIDRPLSQAGYPDGAKISTGKTQS